MNKTKCQMELEGKVEEKIKIYSFALLELNGKQVSGSEAQAIEPWVMENGTIRSSPTELQLKELVRETEAQLAVVLGSKDAAIKALNSWRQTAKTAIVQGIDEIDEIKDRKQARIMVKLMEKKTNFVDQLSDLRQTICGPMRKDCSSVERCQHARKRKAQIADLLSCNEDVLDLCKQLSDQESSRTEWMQIPSTEKRSQDSQSLDTLGENRAGIDSDTRKESPSKNRKRRSTRPANAERTANSIQWDPLGW